MTSPRALVLPVAAGLLVAAATFAAITAVDGDDERGGAGRVAASADGRQSFFQMGCGSCHRFADAGSTGTIGPDLDERLAGYDRASLVQTIGTPPGSGGGGFTLMPDNFGERMTPRALNALAAYLLAARRP